ncbi:MULTISPECIES: GNAT family N-acetyltransferase [unclassified Bacillus (in: firmicutes)]|uniref:GNAT family N-acetyltransferase n=1 Tax=unclassified Bacillus (in: firmicutes) TaxID=185979 RepID=UPI0008E82F1D|nr:MULTISPECIES: GNAT family N-acetyltransferase [unclassified Bacillus (in: firmicutes)]SFA85714.1 Ribosomal protein S18 acetylase RimI [Bacillus sp. UNCCL13]SFQ83507.1 Ribosomal protein S18 acetylase RimI [Bacillus sp. cl95]
MITFKNINIEDSEKIRDIDRSETIEAVYSMKDGVLEAQQAGHECPNWQEKDYQEMISRFEYELSNGGTAYGAFDGDKMVGFGVLAHKFRGKEMDQLQIDLMYVSNGYRRKGIARTIIDFLSKKAIERGAKYLYISSTETQSAVGFYQSCGSRITSEVDKELFEKEPLDIHMLKRLVD